MKTVEIIAEEIQAECHLCVENIMKNVKNCSYEDATNVFLFRKLAELQFEINRLKDEIQIPRK